jgi:hypothetical protein
MNRNQIHRMWIQLISLHIFFFCLICSSTMLSLRQTRI